MSRDWQAGYVNMGGSDAHSGRPMSEPLRETGNQSRESIMLPGKRQWPFSTISLGHQVIGVNTKNIWRWKNPNIRLYLLALQDLNTIIRKDREIEREEGTRSDFINSKLLCSSRENDVYSLNDEFRRGNVLISRMASVWFIQKWLSYFGSNQLMIILNLKKKKKKMISDGVTNHSIRFKALQSCAADSSDDLNQGRRNSHIEGSLLSFPRIKAAVSAASFHLGDVDRISEQRRPGDSSIPTVATFRSFSSQVPLFFDHKAI